MEKITLKAHAREELGKKNKKLRAEGKVPAVAYGHGTKPESLVLESREIEKAFHVAGHNKIIGLKIGDGRAKNVIISEVQREALKGALTHIDFYVVRMDEVLKAEVPLHFVGESTAVYQGEGTLFKNIETIEVECLPANLPESFVVDISVLDDFEKTITIADLDLPEEVKFTTEDLGALIAKVEAPRSEEEMAELDEEVKEELPEEVIEEEPIVKVEHDEEDAERLSKK